MVEGREERANVWASLIGPPGSGKSPAQDLAFAVLRAHDAEHRKVYDAELRAWRALEPRTRPDADRPRDESLLRRDTTVEAIARRLYASGGDLGLDVDELRTLIAGLGQYKSARAGGTGGATGPTWRSSWSLARGALALHSRGHRGRGGERHRPPDLPPHAGALRRGAGRVSAPAGGRGGGCAPAGSPTWPPSPPAPERSEAELTRARRRPRRPATPGPSACAPCSPSGGGRASGRSSPGRSCGSTRLEREWKQRARSPEESASTAAALRKADRQLLRLVLIVAELDDPGGATGGLTVTAARLDAVVPLLEFCLSCWRALPTATALALTHQHAVLNEAVDRLAVWLEHHGGASTRGSSSGPTSPGSTPRGDLNLLLKRYLATFPGTIKTTEPGPQGGRPGRLVLAPKRLRGGGGGGYVAMATYPPRTPPQTAPEAGVRTRRGHGHSW